MRRRSLLSCFSAITILFSQSLLALPALSEQGDNSLSGEIEIEDVGNKKDSYSAVQEKAIQYFDSLQETIESVSQGQSVAAISDLSDSVISYMNAAYLYCSVNLGKCPMILDAIMEVDLINSRSKRVASCGNMTRFWKTWVQSDMENRHKYMVKTGYLKVTSEFNAKERPRYLKCQDTIAEFVNDPRSDAKFYDERYGSDSALNLAGAKVAKLLRDIKRDVPNVFVAVGARPALDAGAASSSSAEVGSKTRRAR